MFNIDPDALPCFEACAFDPSPGEFEPWMKRRIDVSIKQQMRVAVLARLLNCQEMVLYRRSP